MSGEECSVGGGNRRIQCVQDREFRRGQQWVGGWEAVAHAVTSCGAQARIALGVLVNAAPDDVRCPSGAAMERTCSTRTLRYSEKI